MYQRFARLQNLVLLLACLGAAALGTVAVDHSINRQNAGRGSYWARAPMTLNEQQQFYYFMEMNPAMKEHYERFQEMSWLFEGAPAVSVGSITVGQFNAGNFFPLFMGTKPLPVGSQAPDFSLPSASDRHPVHLADFRDKKPVVLFFGSFGCNVFCGQLRRLNQLYQAYKDRAEFLFVYISEAPHPGLLPPPKPGEEFLGRIPRGLRYFNISFPCLLGNQALEKAYTPFPERLLIVDRSGRIALDEGLGLPKGWNLDQVESWLKQI